MLFLFLFLVLGFFGALLVAPNFINWNEYRDKITNNIYSKTGINLEIRGDIKFEILPSPALKINDIHVANIEGAMTADTLKIDKLQVSIAFIPLLGRQLKINNIKLIKPILNIEVLPDGRNNLAAAVPISSNVQPSATPNTIVSSQRSKVLNNFIDGLQVGSLSLSIENFSIQNGFVSYNDHIHGRSEKIEELNGRFSLASSRGPLESSGDAIIRGMPINYSLSTGNILKDRTLPLNFSLKSLKAQTNLRFFGALTQIDKDPKIKGKLTFDSKDMLKLFAISQNAEKLSNSNDRALSIKTSVDATLKRGMFPDIIFRMGKTQGTGKISFQNNNKIDLNVSLVSNKIDIDSYLKRKSNVSKSMNSSINTESRLLPNNSDDLVSLPVNTVFNNLINNLSSFTNNISVMFDLSSAVIIYNKEAIRQVKVNASLEDQEITISQLSALLPGNTDVGLQGIISSELNTKTFQFDGTADLNTGNLRSLLTWLSVKLPSVPRDRLRRLVISSKVLASTKEFVLSNIAGQVDGTKITGKLGTSLNKRPLVDINLNINRMNLGDYLPRKETKKSSLKILISKNQGVSPVGFKTSKLESSGSSINYSFLKKFDANFRIQLGELIIDDLPIKKTIFLGKLRNSKFTVSKFEIGDIAGISAKFGGNISNADKTDRSLDPKFTNVNFVVYARDFVRVLNLLGVKKSAFNKSIGRVKFSGKFTGNYKKLDILGDLDLLGGRLTYNGLVEPAGLAPFLRAKVSIFHPSLSALLKKLGSSYQFRNNKLDRVNLTGDVIGGLTNMSFSNLLGKINNIKIKGKVAVDLTGPKPIIDADLGADTIIINNLLNRKQASLINKSINKYQNYLSNRLAKEPLIIKASYDAISQKSDNRPLFINLAKTRPAPDSLWTKDAIDISVLKKISGDFKFKAKKILYKKHQIDNLNTLIIIKNNVMDIKNLAGNLYGGDIQLDGQIVASSAADRIKTRFKVINFNTAEFLANIGTLGFRRGFLDMSGEFSSSGRATRSYIRKLGGIGKISIRGLEFFSGAENDPRVSGLTNLFQSFQKFNNIILGNKVTSKRINFNTNFTSTNGIVRFKDMTLKTGLGQGTAVGLVNLPKWQIETNGEIKLSQSILTQILLKQKSKPVFLPFNIEGPLDNPSVKLRTSEVTKVGIRLPNILNKTIDNFSREKGLDSVLEKILPEINSIKRKSKGKSQQDSKFPRNKNLPRNDKLPTEDFLKNILKDLTN